MKKLFGGLLHQDHREEEEHVKIDSIKEIQEQLKEQYEAVLDKTSAIWKNKIQHSFIRGQLYDLLKLSHRVLLKEVLDLENLLILDNLIYHLHKFVDSQFERRS